MIHELKTDSDVFQAVLYGYKTWEIRINDRDFKIGDYVKLFETKYSGEEMVSGKPLIYTGRNIVANIKYILNGPIYGLKEGWCIFTIQVESVNE